MKGDTEGQTFLFDGIEPRPGAKSRGRGKGRPAGIGNQVAPVANEHPYLWDMVISELEKSNPNLDISNLNDILFYCRRRDVFGRVKYGVPLQPHNGRDFFQDCTEEFADGLVYWRGIVYERGDELSPEFRALLPSIVRIIGVIVAERRRLAALAKGDGDAGS